VRYGTEVLNKYMYPHGVTRCEKQRKLTRSSHHDTHTHTTHTHTRHIDSHTNVQHICMHMQHAHAHAHAHATYMIE
jgi:hypothetical protein